VDDADPTATLMILQDARRLREGAGLRFQIRVHGVEREAFAIRFRGAVYGYLNSCRHQGLPLDFGDAHFLDESADALVCCHHGARYEPGTGKCIAGPCEGRRLTPLLIHEREGALWCAGARFPARPGAADGDA
jgi:nitrite reductase/ring-hydroxylating ferredoxin subunit